MRVVRHTSQLSQVRRGFCLGGVTLLSTSLILLGSAAQASDGKRGYQDKSDHYSSDRERRKFYLAGSVGLGLSGYDRDGNALGDADNAAPSVATIFKLGGHLTDQVALYWHREAHWWDDSETDEYMAHGLNGVGLTRYENNSAPGWYGALALGVGSVRYVSGSGLDTAYGPGLSLGGGYEFNRHLAVGLTTLYSSTRTSGSDRVEYDTGSAALQLQFRL